MVALKKALLNIIKSKIIPDIMTFLEENFLIENI